MGAVGMFGVPAISGMAAANTTATETIYLTNSRPAEEGQVTDLYTVDLDTTAGVAELGLLFTTQEGSNFQRVDAIAGSPDGKTVVFVDRDSSHLGTYDVGTGQFTDEGPVTGLPSLTVLAAYGLDGELYVASNTTNSLYTIDTAASPPVANLVGEITGATVQGADIVFDSTGTLFLHTNVNDSLYTVDYQNPVSGEVAATAIGQDAGSSLTGLAVRDAGQGDLVGSSRADDAIIVLDKSDGQRTATFAMEVSGTPLDYLNGDMATGVLVDERCVPCDLEEPLKYEYVFEEDGDDEDEHPDVDGFVPEDAPDAFGYLSYVSKEDERYEPISVVFENPGDYCLDSLVVTVKAGKDLLTVTPTEDEDGNLVVSIEGLTRFAISYIEFACVEEDDGSDDPDGSEE